MTSRNHIEDKVRDALIRPMRNQPTLTAYYFSASWCAPCRGFTPYLIQMYQKWRHTHEPIEVILVSSDQDKTQFDKYLSTMPWNAVRFEHRDLMEQIRDEFHIQGIPALVIVDYNGRVVTHQGVKELKQYGDKVILHWLKKSN